MKKILYITDQEEYTKHRFIAPLFEKYLKNYTDVHIVYFSNFKPEIQIKQNNIIVPFSYKDKIIEHLQKEDIDINSYAFIIVRNDIDILKNVLKNRRFSTYKVGYRISFPKRSVQLQINQANKQSSLFDLINHKVKDIKELNLINECDIFLPTSQSMKDEYFSKVKVDTFICPPAIDPEELHQNIQHQKNEKRFFYAGTLDKLREFALILQAFSSLSNKNWKLMISTKDPQFANDLIQEFENITDNIHIHNASSKDELLDLIASADIGVSILPDIPIFNTSIPVKILDYYSSAIPCIMTNNANNKELFENNKEAWYCDFSLDSIANKINEILKLSKEEVAQVGLNGQDKLLKKQNYEIIAKDLFEKLKHHS